MPESSSEGGRRPQATDDDLLSLFQGTVDPIPSTAEVSDALSTDEALRLAVQGDLAGDSELLEYRVDEILKMYAYLRTHGTGEKSDLLDTVDVDATGYAGRGSVWSNMVKGRNTLRALPSVRKPLDGRST